MTFTDEKTRRVREVQLVLPADANIAEGRISILTPIGAALYGLADGARISWPDLDGNERLIGVMRVEQRADVEADCNGNDRPTTPGLRRPPANRFGPDR